MDDFVADDFVEELLKKDDDATNIEIDGSSITYDTIVDIDPDEEQLAPKLEPMMDIFVRITRVIFLSHATLATLITFVAFLPDEFLATHETQSISVFILIHVLVICLALYIAMIVMREHKYALNMFYAWGFSVYFVSVSLASVLHDISPLQFSFCVALQGCSILAYTYVSPRHVDPWKSFYIMLIVGVFGWMTGLYVFIKEQDWITAGVLFALIVGSAAYSAIEIHYVTRYNVGEKELTKAIIQFHSDPVIWVYARILKMIK